MRAQSTSCHLQSGLAGRAARVGLLGLLGLLGCNVGHDTFMLLPLPVELQPGNLMTVFGDIQPRLDPRCGAAFDENAPATMVARLSRMAART